LCHDPKGGGTDQPKVGEETEHFPCVIWHFSFVIELMTVDRISGWFAVTASCRGPAMTNENAK
jgi:hypothetical protein